MRILMIAPEEIPVPPPSGGAVEHTMLQIAERLRNNHQVTIVSRRFPTYPNVTQKGNLTIYRVAASSWTRYLSNALRKIRGMRYDWIQIDNRPLYVAKVRSHFPYARISLFMHSTTFVLPPQVSRKQANAQIHCADLIIGNSYSLKQELSRLFPKYRNKIKYVHLGVDLKQFSPPTIRQKTTVRQKYGAVKSYNVVYAGRLTRDKGVHYLIDAIGRLKQAIPNIRLFIAGGVGPKAFIQFLRSKVRTQSIPCIFLGRVPRRRMHEVYWLGDCMVCPSQRHEAFGLVNVEAMASGTPVIASSNGGIKEVIRHGDNGILVENYRSPDSFAKVILQLRNNPELAKRFVTRGRSDAARRFSWQHTASKLSAMYRQFSTSTNRG